MAEYKVQGPDGKIIIIEGPEGATDEQLKQVAAREYFLTGQTNLPTEQTSSEPDANVGDFFESLVGGTKRIISDTRTALEAPFVSAEEAALRGIKRSDEMTERSGTSLDAVKKTYEQEGIIGATGEVLSQVPTAVAEQTPFIASIVLGAKVGSLAGPAGSAIGAFGALVGSLLIPFLQASGGAMERKAQEQMSRGEEVDINKLGAYGTGLGSAALERAAFAFSGLSKLFGITLKEGASTSAEALAKRSVGMAIAAGGGKLLAAEVPTEVAQQMLERYYADLSLTDDEAKKEYAEAAFGAALLSPLGMYSGYSDRNDAKNYVETKNVKKQEKIDRRVEALGGQQEFDFSEYDKQDPEIESTREQQELDGKINALDNVDLDNQPDTKKKEIDPNQLNLVPSDVEIFGPPLPPPPIEQAAPIDFKSTKKSEVKKFMKDQNLSDDDYVIRENRNIFTEEGDVITEGQKITTKKQAGAREKAKIKEQTTEYFLAPRSVLSLGTNDKQTIDAVADYAINNEATTIGTQYDLIKRDPEKSEGLKVPKSKKGEAEFFGPTLQKQKKNIDKLLKDTLNKQQYNNLSSREDYKTKKIKGSKKDESLLAKIAERYNEKSPIRDEDIIEEAANITNRVNDFERSIIGTQILDLAERLNLTKEDIPQFLKTGSVFGSTKSPLENAKSPDELFETIIEDYIHEEAMDTAEGGSAQIAISATKAERDKIKKRRKKVRKEFYKSTLLNNFLDNNNKYSKEYIEEQIEINKNRPITSTTQAGLTKNQIKANIEAQENAINYDTKTDTQKRIDKLKGEKKIKTLMTDDDFLKNDSAASDIADALGLDSNVTIDEMISEIADASETSQVTRVLKESPNMRVALTNMLNVLQKRLNKAINDTDMDSRMRQTAENVLRFQISLVNALSKVDGLQNVNLNILSIKEMEKRNGKNSTTKGAYVSDTNINKNEVYLVDSMTSALTTRVFLHEATHMATTYGIRGLTNQELVQWSNIFQAAKQRAREQGVKDKDMGEAGLYYGLKNLKEFIAEAFSNPEFQQFLQKTPSVLESQPSRGRFVSLFDDFVNAIKQMLSLQTLDNTLLNDTINMSANLFSFGPRPAFGSIRAKIIQKRVDKIRRQNMKEDGLPQYVIDDMIPPSVEGISIEYFDDGAETTEERRVRIKENNNEYTNSRPGKLGSFFKEWFGNGQESVDKISEKFVDSASRLKRWQRNLRGAGGLISGISGFNNIYTQLTLMNGKASDYLKGLMPILQEYEQSIAQFYTTYKEANPDSDDGDARAFLQDILTGQHELERREIKYMLSVPLSDDKFISYVNPNGQTIVTSPAALRIEIMETITESKSEISKKILDGYKQTLLKLADPNNTVNGKKTVDEKNGVRYKQTSKYKTSKGGSIDITNSEYDVTNLSYDAAVEVRNEFDLLKTKNPALYNSMKRIQEHMDKVQRGVKPNTKNPNGVKGILELNQIGNFNPVQAMNIIDMYGWQNYLPLKGRKEDSEEINAALDPNSSSIKLSRKDKTVAATFEGNVGDAADPFVQLIVDASQAAARAGRINFTQAIYNAITQKVNYKDEADNEGKPRGFLDGKIEKIFTYDQRYNNDSEIQTELEKKNTVVHFLDDGSLVIMSIKDDGMLTSIRGLANEKNTMLDIANSVTGAIGQLHTRFNLKFAPLNFVRDAITNLYLIGTDLGLSDMAGFAQNVAEQVYKGGMKQTWKIVSMYNKNELDKLAEYVKVEVKKGNTYPRDMVEYLVEGGMVAITQSLSNQTAYEQLVKEISPTKILQTKKQVTTWFDTYMGTFELASRVAAYRVFRDNYIAKNSGGKTGAQIPEGVMAGAREEAAAYAKELANFEKMGTSGRTLGGFYMFFRASSVGAARALESISPALISLETAIDALDITIKGNPERLAAFKKNYMEERAAAQKLMMTGFGLGVTVYFLSAMMSGDMEDDGEDKTINDDLSRWTRFARFDASSLPGFKKGDVVQIPWGFGLGGIPAIGAQIAGLAANENSPRSIMANMLEITLDSFAPIPVSRMDPTEGLREGATWFLDSISPTALRPILEYSMNTNAFGSPITNLMYSRRYGSAYQSMGNTPQLFKDMAITVAEETNGAIVPNPDVLYFFANNYFDAVSTTTQNLYSLGLTAQGKKDFEAKFDTILFGSFFSKYSKIDQRAYARASQKIEKLESKLDLFKDTNPQKYYEVLQKNPMGPTTVDMFNDMKAQLNKLNQQARVVREYPGLTPKERKSMLEPIKNLQNILKRQITAAVDMALPE